MSQPEITPELPQTTYNGRCNGITKAGSQCRHVVVFANGFCKQHGGQTPQHVMQAALEREKARIAASVEKLKRRFARFDRKFGKRHLHAKALAKANGSR